MAGEFGDVEVLPYYSARWRGLFQFSNKLPAGRVAFVWALGESLEQDIALGREKEVVVEFGLLGENGAGNLERFRSGNCDA